MPGTLRLAIPALAASLLIAACGSSSSGSASSSAVVKTGSSSLGKVLVDSRGMTLYHLSSEKDGRFICTNSACVGVWHPLTVAAGSTPSGEVGSLGTVKRPDGTTQVTYAGTPLYTFVQDQHAGETKGQGVRDVGTWTVVAAPARSSSASRSSGTSSGGATGGGYGR